MLVKTEGLNILKKVKYNPLLKISVSDFSRVNWCELQHHYESIFGRPAPTEHMMLGVQRHTELELEVHKLEKIEVLSEIDSLGLKFYDTLSRINTFLETGIAREIRIFGFLGLRSSDSKALAVGIIDLIQRKAIPGCPEKDQIFLIDNKTRVKESLPSKLQSENHNLQLMLYKKLFDELISCGKKVAILLKHSPASIENLKSALDGTDLSLDELFDALRIDYRESFSDLFLAQLFDLDVPRLLGRSDQDISTITILDIFKALLISLSKLPYSSSELTLSYEHQKTRRHIGELKSEFNQKVLDKSIQTKLEYFMNLRKPIGVTDIKEARFKCRYCSFADICNWRKEMAL